MKCSCCDMELTEGYWYVFSCKIVDGEDFFAMTPFKTHEEAVEFIKDLQTKDKWLLSQEMWEKVKSESKGSKLTQEQFGERWGNE